MTNQVDGFDLAPLTGGPEGFWSVPTYDLLLLPSTALGAYDAARAYPEYASVLDPALLSGSTPIAQSGGYQPAPTSLADWALQTLGSTPTGSADPSTSVAGPYVASFGDIPSLAAPSSGYAAVGAPVAPTTDVVTHLPYVVGGGTNT